MIARTWRGTVGAGDGHAYLELIERTGMAASRETPGNRGFFILQRPAGDRDEILTVSLWDSLDAIAAFAGHDITRARFFPHDDEHLVDRDLHADHWEVLGAFD